MKPKRIILYAIDTISGKSHPIKILNDNNVNQRINEEKAKYTKQPNIIFKLSL